MANYFLASVGNADAFRMVNGKLQHVLSARTLTESTISVSSTMEDVRAGQGAKLFGRFNHDAGMTVSLTDAMFKLEYIALQVGSNINSTGASHMFTEKLKPAEGGVFTLSNALAAMGKSCGLNKAGVWVRPVGCDANDEYTFAEATVGSTSVTVEGVDITKDYCVTYFKDEEGAREVLINANFVPAEMILFLTAKLFAGDASAPETGKPVGEITVKIPRFQLDGTFDLSMAMSSAATMALNGTVLAVDSNGCESDGAYAEIVEVINGRKWYDGLRAVEYSEEDDTVYGIYEGGFTSALDSTLTGITIKEPTADAAGSVTISDGSYSRTFTIPQL